MLEDLLWNQKRCLLNVGDKTIILQERTVPVPCLSCGNTVLVPINGDPMPGHAACEDGGKTVCPMCRAPTYLNITCEPEQASQVHLRAPTEGQR